MSATPSEKTEKKPGLFARLKAGLAKSTGAISDGVAGIFTRRKLDGETLEELEDLLIQADLGVDAAMEVAEAVGRGRYDKEISPDEVRAVLADEVARILKPSEADFDVGTDRPPFVVLVVGVNGTGKTTTIGKIASRLRQNGKSVMLAAGDTFRAAAIEQLKVWGERVGAPVVARALGADAAGLAYDAFDEARRAGSDVLIIDTAGRLQNKSELMDELKKIRRVINRIDEEAPHAVLLVLDATTGQNAVSQVEVFSDAVGITGLVMTKLDGTARGGILVAIAKRFGLPVHFVGVGEKTEDLQPFDAAAFARALTGSAE